MMNPAMVSQIMWFHAKHTSKINRKITEVFYIVRTDHQYEIHGKEQLNHDYVRIQIRCNAFYLILVSRLIELLLVTLYIH